MNIVQPSKTRKLKVFLLFILLLQISISQISAQQSDTIVPIQKNPESILKNLRIGKIEDGFNIWHDKFTGHWAGIDFGFNAFTGKNYFGFQPGFMDNDVFRSNSTYINLIGQSIGLQHNKNTVGLVTGLGLHLQSYRLDNNTTIRRQTSNFIEAQTLFFDQNQKSKLSLVSLNVPLLAEVQIPVNHYKNRFYFSGGFIFGYRLSSHTKIKYRADRKKEKLKIPDNYSLTDFKYGLMLRTGYRWINVFVTYDFSPFFKPKLGPQLTPVTFGVTLLRF